MKESFKNNFKLLRRGGTDLLIFEAVYKLLAAVVVAPLLYLAVKGAIKASGNQYVADNNMKEVLTDPVTIIILIVVLIIAALYSLVEMSALAVDFHYIKKEGRRLSPGELFKAGIKGAKGIIHPKNFLMVIFVLLIIPLAGIAVTSGFAASIQIPEFILHDIFTTPMFMIPFVILILFLMQLTIKWMYSIHFFVLEKKNFKDAHRESRKMVKGKFWHVLGYIICWEILIAVIFAVIYIVLIALAALGVKLIGESNSVALATFLSFFKIMNLILVFIMAAAAVPACFAHLSEDYYEEGGKLDSAFSMDLPPARKERKISARGKRFGVVAAAAAVVICSIYMYQGLENQVFSGVQQLNLPKISAHRGDAVSAPENTIPAFESAIKHKADYAELDVHQTKDGVLVVCHDESLDRTTGYDADICDTNYSKIKTLDAGSFFSDKFKGTKVPTLDQVMDACKGKIKLNIELKPNKKNKGFEQQVVDTIKKHGFTNKCVVTSLDHDSITKVNKLDPKLECGVILTVGVGDLQKMPGVDFFSLDSSFINEDLMEAVHKEGKEVHAWTVDNEDHTKEMAELGVDNIITNDPVQARAIIYSKNMNSRMQNIMEFVFQ